MGVGPPRGMTQAWVGLGLGQVLSLRGGRFRNRVVGERAGPGLLLQAVGSHHSIMECPCLHPGRPSTLTPHPAPGPGATSSSALSWAVADLMQLLGCRLPISDLELCMHILFIKIETKKTIFGHLNRCGQSFKGAQLLQAPWTSMASVGTQLFCTGA